MSNMKVETLQCCVPVFDPDALSNEQHAHTGEKHDGHNEEQRKNNAHAIAGCQRVHIIAAFKPSDSLLLKAALRGIILQFYLYRAP